MWCLQPVTLVLHLENAQRLGALTDGQLLLLDADTMEGQPLPGIKVRQPYPWWGSTMSLHLQSECDCMQLPSHVRG